MDPQNISRHCHLFSGGTHPGGEPLGLNLRISGLLGFVVQEDGRKPVKILAMTIQCDDYN
jgi:hypothetical protein